MGRALTAVLVLAMLMLAGCGGGSGDASGGEAEQGQEKGNVKPKTVNPEGATRQETTIQTAEIIPDAVIGENVSTPQFDFRILDIFVTDHYFYNDDPSIDFVVDAYSQAGKFVVMNYSMTNTSPETVTANLGARLFVRAGSETEVYEEAEQPAHPRTAITMGGPELRPRELLLGQFIFDVPTDVQPETLAVLYEDEIEEPRGEAGSIDLTNEEPQGPRPQEILALQYEYGNMTAWAQSYDLFAPESKAIISEQAYISALKKDPPFAIMQYSFPSVRIQGDRAVIERVFTYSEKEGTGQDKATQEAVLTDEGWRIIMRDDQIQSLRQG